jgi:hypothetical protein
MKKLFIATSIATCVILATGCVTVKENENAEEKELDRNVIRVEDYGTFKKIVKFDDLGDTIYTFEGDKTAIQNHIFGYNNLSLEEIRARNQNIFNEGCKSKVSVFPNPTSNFVTLDFDWGSTPQSAFPIHFRYDLIFDQKIIHSDNILNHKAQIVIPEHLLKKEGVYTIAFEFFLGEFDFPYCKNTISFMVVKTR